MSEIEIEDDMSEPEDDPAPCVCADCQNAREQATSETEGSAGQGFKAAIAQRDATIALLTARVDRFAVRSSQDLDHAVKAISERDKALRTIADRDATIETLTAEVERLKKVKATSARLQRDYYVRRQAALSDPIQAADDRRAL